MENTTEKDYPLFWNFDNIKKLSDEDLVRQYQEIKQNSNLIDPIYLTEICTRNLLTKIG